MKATAVPLIFGMLAMGFAVAAAFFLRFWRTTREPVFGWFAAAFGLLAAQRIAAMLSANWLENEAWLYSMRLVAFVLIIVAIIAQNRPRRAG